MDKKSLISVVALGVILICIIAAVFLYDGKINTTILEVNGVKYSKSDFESYLKLWQYENGEEAVDIDNMYDNYKAYKLYSQYVENYHVSLPSGEKVTALTEEEKTNLLVDYNLTDSEYMRVKTEIETVDYLFSNLQEYWKVSDEDYEEHKGSNADKFKMYDYRVMQVQIEEAEELSGDVSGDSLSGDVSGDNGEQARKDAAMSKAVEALAKVKSGDSFEEVAKEYGTNRITYTNGGYSIVNGTVETVSGLYMSDYVWDENILNALQTLNKGEYSQIYEGDGYYTFVYLEDIREGLDEYDDNTYKRQIANEHIQGEAIIVENKITLRSIKLVDLIPMLSKVGNISGDNISTDENHDHDHDHTHEDEDVTLDSEEVDTLAGGETAE